MLLCWPTSLAAIGVARRSPSFASRPTRQRRSSPMPWFAPAPSVMICTPACSPSPIDALPADRLRGPLRSMRLAPSSMVQPIGLADYAAMLGLPHPDAGLTALGEELATIALYSDTLDALRRVRAEGVKVAVASNLALPYATPLKALLGDLVDVWHLSFSEGVIKPDRTFYGGLTAKLGCEPSELLMVGDTWRDDIVGAVEAGSRARWVDREGRASHPRRFIAVRELGDAYPDRDPATQKTEMELVIESIDANLDYLHNQRWAIEAGRLRHAVANVYGTERAAATQALNDHYDTRDQPEISRSVLIRDAMAAVEARRRV